MQSGCDGSNAQALASYIMQPECFGYIVLSKCYDYFFWKHPVSSTLHLSQANVSATTVWRIVH